MSDIPHTPASLTGIFTTDDIPNRNTINLEDMLKEKPLIEYYNLITYIIQKFKEDQTNHKYIPSLLMIPSHVLMKHNYVKSKETTYNIKFDGKTKYYRTINNIKDNEVNVVKKRTYDDDFHKLIGYSIKDLPVLAELLAIGNNMHQDSVKQRLDWMLSFEMNFKYNDKNVDQVEYQGQIHSLIDDIVHSWIEEYVNGWTKLVRYFLLGTIMHGYYENNLSDAENKTTDEEPREMPSLENRIKRSVKILIPKIIDEQTSAIIDKEMTRIVQSNVDTYTTTSRLKRDLKEEIKFSLYLFYFVRMFGFVALISSSLPNPTHGYLKSLNPKNLNVMYDYLNTIKEHSNNIGADFISQNNKFAKSICDTVLICAKKMKISTPGLEKSLNNLVSKYLLNIDYNDDYTATEHSSYTTSNNNITSEIINNVGSIRNIMYEDNEDNGRIKKQQPVKISRKGVDITKVNHKGEEKQRRKRLRGTNRTYGQIKFQTIAVDASHINDQNRIVMNNYIAAVELALNEKELNKLKLSSDSKLNSYNNFDEKDAKILAKYNEYGNFVSTNNVKILNNLERENIVRNRNGIITAIGDDTDMYQIYDDTYKNLYSKMEKDLGFGALSDEDKQLLVTQETINECLNNDKMMLDDED
jgi:hypothetical protein